MAVFAHKVVSQIIIPSVRTITIVRGQMFHYHLRLLLLGQDLAIRAASVAHCVMHQRMPIFVGIVHMPVHSVFVALGVSMSMHRHALTDSER